MVSVAAHELAHSWFGNLVTNATWEDFWLNEGWTMWAENRLVEEVFGIDVANLGRAIMDGEVEKDIERFIENGTPELTHLKWNLTGIDPDDAFSRVPYQKGVRFLEALEALVGREAFDAFARSYIHAFRFSTITTSEFIAFLRANLPGGFEAVLGWEWVYEAGMPKSALPLVSPLITEIHDYATRREIPSAETVATWRPIQVGLYLEYFPRPATEAELDMLERRLTLGRSQNADILCNWLLLCVESSDEENQPQIRTFLEANGRMKYLRPLYKALAMNPMFSSWAHDVFKELRSNYHPIAQQAIERAFAEAARS